MNRKRPAIKYENTVPGTFVRRVNRFIAEVMINDNLERVHVKNTGRLRELLVPVEWVNIDSLAPNKLVKLWLMGQDFDIVKPEFTFGDSRFDFYMERDGEKYLTEVKGCTLAADLKRGIGLFPDAPTKRGVKHLDELAAAAKKGYHCRIAFVIQMNGIHQVSPNDATQPEFGQALRRAAEAGVQVVCYGCRVEADSIEIVSDPVCSPTKFCPITA